jgi:hypothetical protein
VGSAFGGSVSGGDVVNGILSPVDARHPGISGFGPPYLWLVG